MYTRHAEARCQQRGIRPEIVDAILAYGRRIHRHHAEVCYVDKPARRRIERELGQDAYRRIVDRLNNYVVLANSGASSPRPSGAAG